MKSTGKIIIIILLIIALLTASYYKSTLEAQKQAEQASDVVEDDEQVEQSIYKRSARPTKLLDDIYNKLEKAHKRHGNFEVEYVAAYFTCDFFTWSNKTEREDIGGINLVLPQEREDFASFALRDYYVNFVELQEEYGAKNLPEVVSYKVISNEDSEFVYNAEGFEDLKYKDITIEFEYEPSDDYDVSILKSEATITVVNYNDYWYVVGVDYQNV